MRRTKARARLIALVAAFTVIAAACGDDGEPTAQERYCEAGEALEASVAALGDLDLVSEGVDGVRAAIDDVASDIGELRDTASEAAQTEVEALSDAVDGLESSLSDLGGDLSLDNASAVITAIETTVSAAQAVYDTLSDCP